MSSQDARMSEDSAQRIAHILPDGGEAWWWFAGLAQIKLSGKQTEGRFSLIEVLYPSGVEVPLHIHTREDELFHILEGTISYRVGVSRIEAGPGHTIFAPRNIPHGFTGTSPGASRYLIAYSPAGFEDFVRETSRPAQSLTLPPNLDGPIDSAVLEKVATMMAAKYGCHFVR